MEPDELARWERDDTPTDAGGFARREAFATTQQAAKAINSGIINGLGVRGIIQAARQASGVRLTVAEATDFRVKLVQELYPELGRYLEDDGSVQQRRVATLSGRIRGPVDYTQGHSTPVQGLGADGAGLALFALIQAGYHVVTFIHDEFLIEVPDEGSFVRLEECERIKRLVCDAMAQVLPNVPVDAKYTLSRMWSKDAQLLIDGGRVLAWPPDMRSATL